MLLSGSDDGTLRLWDLHDFHEIVVLRLDSRIGFEASNQYYYVPLDLVEKVLNCRDLLDRWLPAQRAKWGLE